MPLREAQGTVIIYEQDGDIVPGLLRARLSGLAVHLCFRRANDKG